MLQRISKSDIFEPPNHLIMIEVLPTEKDTLDSLLKTYKRKIDRIGLIKKLRGRLFFEKKSEREKKKKQRAILRERYKRLHGLV